MASTHFGSWSQDLINSCGLYFWCSHITGKKTSSPREGEFPLAKQRVTFPLSARASPAQRHIPPPPAPVEVLEERHCVFSSVPVPVQQRIEEQRHSSKAE